MTDALNSSQGRTSVEGEAPEKRNATIGRVLVIAALLVAAVFTIHLTPVHSWLGDTDRLRRELANLGAWVYPVTVLAVALLVACGAPRLLF